MIHEYKGKEDLKDALRHYGRKGMRKGFHLPGTEWWKLPSGNKSRKGNSSIDLMEKETPSVEETFTPDEKKQFRIKKMKNELETLKIKSKTVGTSWGDKARIIKLQAAIAREERELRDAAQKRHEDQLRKERLKAEDEQKKKFLKERQDRIDQGKAADDWMAQQKERQRKVREKRAKEKQDAIRRLHHK